MSHRDARYRFQVISPQVGFVSPPLYPPLWGGHIPPHGKICIPTLRAYLAHSIAKPTPNICPLVLASR